MAGFKQYPSLLNKLSTHKTSKAYIYINKLARMDVRTLKEHIKQSPTYES